MVLVLALGSFPFWQDQLTPLLGGIYCIVELCSLLPRVYSSSCVF